MLDRDILTIMVDEALASLGSKQFVPSSEVVNLLLDIRLYVSNEDFLAGSVLEESTVGASA